MKIATADSSSILANDIQNYLHYKRSLGNKFHTEATALCLLDRYIAKIKINNVVAITASIIDAFLISRPRKQPRSYNHLLSVIRCFFRWLVVQERLADSPVHARPKKSNRSHPFLFSCSQAKHLLELASSLADKPKGPHRGQTYHLIFSLMYALGLRVGEVSRLCVKDVDFKRQLLIIRETKFSKDRLVPFGPNIQHQLSSYLQLKESYDEKLAVEAPFFTFNGGKPIHPGTISQTFHHIVTEQPFDIPPGTSPPRLHCLRHSFSVGTLLRWYRAGINPNQRLIHLSTFLGHVDPLSTAWYLTITDKLLDEANQRYEKTCSPLKEGDFL
jgi:site-specific recombinase XerD